MGRNPDWRGNLDAIAKELGNHENVSDALPAIGRIVGAKVTKDNVRWALGRVGRVPSDYLKQPAAPTPDAIDGEFSHLIVVLKKGPVGFEALCDRFNMSPTRMRDMIRRAQDAGVMVHVEHDHVAFHRPDEPDQVQDVKVKPITGERQRIGVISDLHAGSKYILRDQLIDCVKAMADAGVTEILVPGDLLDGVYKHSMFEQSHTGMESQTRDLFETLPAIAGVRYYAITGNHDETFTSANGVDVGHFVEGYFSKHGRDDLKFYGRRSAFLRVRGALIHMWHPRSGGAYAKSYPLQKKCEGYSSIKPQILLAGHWHRFAVVEERSIQAIACPTFQGTGGRNGSEFGNSLVGNPAIGGLLLSWFVTKDGTLREFQITRRSYFEREKPVDVYNAMDAEPLETDDERAPRGARKGVR